MPDDPEYSPFRNLASALDAAQGGAKLAELDRVLDAATNLLKALEPFTPAQLDDMHLTFASLFAQQAAQRHVKGEARDWIRLDNGHRLDAYERPVGTRVWDADGREWICVSPAPDAWIWKDPSTVTRLSAVHQAPPGM